MQIINLDDLRKAKLVEQRLWMERLWAWADLLDIKEYNVPRNEHELLNLTHLSFESYRYYGRDKFPELPKEIGNLKKLKFLELGHVVNCSMQFLNNLNALPKEIGQLTELTHLYVQDNSLTELPKEIGNLTLLKELKLGFNHLTKLPKEIGNLTKFRHSKHPT